MVSQILEKIQLYVEKGGVYLALVAFLALLVAGLRVLDEADGGLLQLRTARSDFEDYYNASVRMAEKGDLYRIQAARNMEESADPGIDINNPIELLRFSMTPEGKAYLESIRGAGSYLYLPFFAFLLLPLSFVGYEVAVMVFQISCLVLLWTFFVLIRRSHDHMSREEFWYRAVLSMLPVASFLSENAANANVGFLLVFLCGGGLLLSTPDLTVESASEKKRPVHWMQYVGGALLGMAAVIKIMPVILGLYLVASRSYRALIGATLAGIACLFLPALYAGWGTNLGWHLEWYEMMIHTYSQYGVVRPYANNQTISAAISKLFVAGSDPDQSTVGLPLIYRSLEELGSAGAFWLRTIIKTLVYGFLAMAVFMAILFSLRRKFLRPDKRPARIYFIQSLVLISLLVSGVSWFHAYSLLLVPLALRVYEPTPWSAEEFSMAGLIAFSGFGNLLFSGIFRDYLALYSVHAWLMVALTVWSMTLVFRFLRKEAEYA
ncbi:MAG: DUF2029 domain-containing protein [Leptospiraceae bacterium]|nr:DUF2029 domain-containing protein [Leptospiraceae bacterium]